MTTASADIARINGTLNVFVNARPLHEAGTHGFHSHNALVSVVQLTQQCVTITTGNNNPGAPHEAPVVDTELVSPLSVGLWTI